MTQLTEFAIGVDKSHLHTFASLGVPAPLPKFQPYAETRTFADGKMQGVGLPVCTLEWGQIWIPQRNALRVYLTGLSTAVTITLPTKEYSGGSTIANEVWKTYDCIVDWPFPEPTNPADVHKTQNFVLTVRMAVQVTPV